MKAKFYLRWKIVRNQVCLFTSFSFTAIICLNRRMFLDAEKLKEMGNSVLGRFGMSLDNFKAVKDPNTGSYSISMER